MSENIWTFLSGLLTGGVGGALLTLKITRQNKLEGNGSIVDQSAARAGGDIVGGNKTLSSNKK